MSALIARLTSNSIDGVTVRWPMTRRVTAVVSAALRAAESGALSWDDSSFATTPSNSVAASDVTCSVRSPPVRVWHTTASIAGPSLPASPASCDLPMSSRLPEPLPVATKVRVKSRDASWNSASVTGIGPPRQASAPGKPPVAPSLHTSSVTNVSCRTHSSRPSSVSAASLKERVPSLSMKPNSWWW